MKPRKIVTVLRLRMELVISLDAESEYNDKDVYMFQGKVMNSKPTIKYITVVLAIHSEDEHENAHNALLDLNVVALQNGNLIQKFKDQNNTTPILGKLIKQSQYCRCDENLSNPIQDCGCALGQCAKGRIF